MTDTAQRKRQIEARLQELGVRLQRIEDVLDDTELSDLEDQTIEWEDDEVQAGIGRASLREARFLTGALKRIANGTYGTCMSCGEQIAEERLDLIPMPIFVDTALARVRRKHSCLAGPDRALRDHRQSDVSQFMMEADMTRKASDILAMALCCLVGGAASAQDTEAEAQTDATNGMIFLINVDEDEDMDGLLQWEKELRARGLTAMVDVSGPVLDAHPQLFKRLAQNGHAVIGGNSEVCWDVPYEEQYQAMLAVKTNVESLTGKPMQVFGCKYFSYDENTVKAAEALGVPYVLGRGTEDIRALIHKPEEYDVGIIKVSNVEFSGMGRGSLCDISLYWRGATDADFADMVKASLAQSPDSMILVSHPHIGGTKVGYWNVYADALESPAVEWRSFEDWLDHVAVVTRPYADIPENREVQYLDPTPVVPLDQLQDLPAVGEKLVMFHNGLGPMCKDAQDFLAGLDYPLEEHLIGDKNFHSLLDRYRIQFPQSEGVSDAYEYFPIIFVKGRAFSGFDKAVRTAIEAEIDQ